MLWPSGCSAIRLWTILRESTLLFSWCFRGSASEAEIERLAGVYSAGVGQDECCRERQRKARLARMVGVLPGFVRIGRVSVY